MFSIRSPSREEILVWWRVEDLNLRRYKTGRFTICFLWPLGQLAAASVITLTWRVGAVKKKFLEKEDSHIEVLESVYKFLVIQGIHESYVLLLQGYGSMKVLQE